MILKYKTIVKLNTALVVSFFGLFGSSIDENQNDQSSLHSSCSTSTCGIDLNENDTADTLMKKGVESCNEGDFARAIEYFQKVRKKPDCSPKYVAFSFHFEGRTNKKFYDDRKTDDKSLVRKAIDNLQQAVNIKNNERFVLPDLYRQYDWSLLGDLYFINKNFSDANGAYSEVFQIGNWRSNNEKVETLFEWAAALHNMGDYYKALEKLDEIVRIDNFERIDKLQLNCRIGFACKKIRKQSMDMIIIHKYVQKEVGAYLEVLKNAPNYPDKEKIAAYKAEVAASLTEIENGEVIKTIQHNYFERVRAFQFEVENTSDIRYLEFSQKHVDDMKVVAHGDWLWQLVLDLRAALSEVNSIINNSNAQS